MSDDLRYLPRTGGGYSVLATGGDVRSADVIRLERAETPPLRMPIDLARETAFAIGRVLFEPSTRQVVNPDGSSETLEPRVMEVLVALHRADGAILSRDDLIAACWRGMVVGEDAIQRVIQRLRKLAAATGAFRIETITKVGYRLIAIETAGPTPPVFQAPSLPSSGFSLVAFLAYAVLLSVAVAIGFRATSDGAAMPQHHLALGTGTALAPEDRAGTFQAALKAGLLDRDVPLTARSDDLVLNSTLQEDGTKATASAVFEDRARGRTLWAGSRDFPAGVEGSRVSAEWVAGMVGCAFGWLKDEPSATSSPVMPIVMKACEVAGTPDFDRQLQIGREMIEADPASTIGYRLVAYAAHGLDLRGLGTPATHAEGVSANAHFRALQPTMSGGIAAQALLLPSAQAVERERLLRKATDPRLVHCDCALEYLGDFLLQSGRASEARAVFGRADAQSPHETIALQRSFNAAEALGLYGTADTYAAKIAALPGTEADIHLLDLKRGLWRGDRAALNREVRRISGERDAFMQAIRASLDAVANGDPAKRREAAGKLAAIAPEPAREPLKVELYAVLGDFDRAFALMEDSRRRGTSFAAPGASPGLAKPLAWSPALRTLRRDPRFAGWLKRAGFFAYWHTTNSFPDECGTAAPPPYCALIRKRVKEG